MLRTPGRQRLVVTLVMKGGVKAEATRSPLSQRCRALHEWWGGGGATLAQMRGTYDVYIIGRVEKGLEVRRRLMQKFRFLSRFLCTRMI
jgi:hypothetical protein